LDTRFKQLKHWLINDLGYALNSLETASADASFRRYFRAVTQSGTFIVMDAPPDKEPVSEFIRAADDLASCGVHTPHVHYKNLTDGYLVLEDLGSRTYLDELKDQPKKLYTDAINALIKIQSGINHSEKSLWPDYDNAKLTQEMDLFDDWYLQRHLSISMTPNHSTTWRSLKSTLLEACNEQPKTWVHRDYHSRNLMITDTNSPGVIDFQDMVVGPIAYDLASIFKDCYIRWTRQQQLGWLREYYQALNNTENPNFSFEQLTRWFDFTGLQRHLKVLGIFCRLYYRDGKKQYLNDLPMVAGYIIEVIDLYEEFLDFKNDFSTLIKQSI